MTPEETRELNKINSMTRMEMCRLWRFAPPGHPYFQQGPLYDAFIQRFKELGEFSPEISKELGWDQ